MKRCSHIMNSRRPRSPARFGTSLVALAGALALGTALAACGSSSSSNSPSTKSNSDVSTGVKYAQGLVTGGLKGHATSCLAIGSPPIAKECHVKKGTTAASLTRTDA